MVILDKSGQAATCEKVIFKQGSKRHLGTGRTSSVARGLNNAEKRNQIASQRPHSMGPCGQGEDFHFILKVMGSQGRIFSRGVT